MDHFYRFYLLIGGIHYSLDAAVKLKFYGIAGIMGDDCRRAFFVHHICTVIMFRSMWMVETFTWFVALPSAYHNVLVAFPHFVPWNNYMYGIGLICFFVCQLCLKPFNRNNVHRGLLVNMLLIAIPIYGMSLADDGELCAS